MKYVDEIILEPVQKELIVSIVEAARNIPLDKRRKFVVSQSHGGDELLHPGFQNDKMSIYFGDVQVLAYESLVSLEYGSSGVPLFDVTPLGFRYYEYLKEESGEPVERIEKTMKFFIDAPDFQKKYPAAYEKWLSAEELLWKSDSHQQLTTIGHLCREAVQEFADSLVKIYSPPDVTNEKSKTVARIKAILKLRLENLGDTKKAFLDALLSYWGTVNDLIQRQEHGGQIEGHPLIWEDARIVVFHTLIVMFEIDKTL